MGWDGVLGKEAPRNRSSVSSIEKDGGSPMGWVKIYENYSSEGVMERGTLVFWLFNGVN